MKSTQQDEKESANVNPPTVEEKAERKRAYNRVRQSNIRAAAAHSIEKFKLPFNPNKNSDSAKIFYDVYGSHVGELQWTGTALDGTFLSREVRRRLVLGNFVNWEADSHYFEVPHFGGDDDAEILNSSVTVHEACAIASNVCVVTERNRTLDDKVTAMEKEMKELKEQVAALTLALTT